MKAKNTILLIILINIPALLMPVKIYAQPTLQWSVRYNFFPDNHDEWANDMVIDSAGNVYTTGCAVTTARSNNFLTMKYNSAGQYQWAKMYDGPGSNGIDEAMAIAMDKYGNIYVTGHSERAGLYSDDYCTIKYDNNGVQQWVARYSGPLGTGQHDPQAIAVDNNGNVFVTGYSTGTGSDFDYLTIKYNNNGDTLWTRRYAGVLNHDDYSWALALDNEGSIYVTGSSFEGAPYRYSCTTIKYNPNGSVSWLNKATDPSNTGGRRIVIDKFKNAYICGEIGATTDFLTIKYTQSGQILWEKSYGGSSSDYTQAIATDSNLNIIVTGWIYSTTTKNDYLTIKYNNNGDTLWTRRYNGTAGTYDEATALCVDKNNDIYVSGRSTGTSGYDFTTLKYSASGTQQWVTRYPGGADKIQVDKNLNLYLAGTNTVAGTGLDIILLKYSQPVGIKPISNTIINSYKLYQNYPNPFNSETIIEFDIPKTEDIEITIYDITGKMLKDIFRGQLNSGHNYIRFNAENLSTGIYFCCLKSSGIVRAVKKISLIK